MIPQKTSTGTTLIPLESMEYENRILYVEGEITAEKASDFIRKIISLNRRDNITPIKIMITSEGGSVIYGMAMYDAICTSKAPVETYCVGTAYSMAAIIFAAGKKRYMLEHSKIMLHEPLVMNGVVGRASSVKSMSDTLQNTKRQINELLCKHSGKTIDEMEAATSYDHYFSAEEAIEFGLADEVVGIESIL